MLRYSQLSDELGGGQRRQSSGADSTKLPLAVWFRTTYRMTHTKQDIRSLELMGRLGVSSQPTAVATCQLADVVRGGFGATVRVSRNDGSCIISPPHPTQLRHQMIPRIDRHRVAGGNDACALAFLDQGRVFESSPRALDV